MIQQYDCLKKLDAGQSQGSKANKIAVNTQPYPLRNTETNWALRNSCKQQPSAFRKKKLHSFEFWTNHHTQFLNGIHFFFDPTTSERNESTFENALNTWKWGYTNICLSLIVLCRKPLCMMTLFTENRLVSFALKCSSFLGNFCLFPSRHSFNLCFENITYSIVNIHRAFNDWVSSNQNKSKPNSQSQQGQYHQEPMRTHQSAP